MTRQEQRNLNITAQFENLTGAIGGGVGAVTAFTVTTIATACPPIAIVL